MNRKKAIITFAALESFISLLIIIFFIVGTIGLKQFAIMWIAWMILSFVGILIIHLKFKE